MSDDGRQGLGASVPSADDLISIQSEQIAFAHRDNALLREAGFELAAAGARVVQDYDGLHRLSLAIAGWFKAIACQGGRPHHPPEGE